MLGRRSSGRVQCLLPSATVAVGAAALRRKLGRCPTLGWRAGASSWHPGMGWEDSVEQAKRLGEALLLQSLLSFSCSRVGWRLS